MKIVAISTLSPHHRFVLASAHQSWPLRCVIQPVWGERASTNSRFARFVKSPVKGLTRRCRRMLKDWRDRRRDRDVAKALDAFATTPALNVERRAVLHSRLNDDETATLLRGHQPDVIVTSGCPILKPEIFGIARLATINVHWGIAPKYRGENTLFWPLYFGDCDNIGVTIHKIDDGIDTGPVFAHGFPELAPSDNEVTLFANSARIAAELLPEVLARISRTQSTDGVSTNSRGRLFLARDRTVVHDIAYWTKRKLGRGKIPCGSARRMIYIGKPLVDGCQIQKETAQELSR